MERSTPISNTAIDELQKAYLQLREDYAIMLEENVKLHKEVTRLRMRPSSSDGNEQKIYPSAQG